MSGLHPSSWRGDIAVGSPRSRVYGGGAWRCRTRACGVGVCYYILRRASPGSCPRARRPMHGPDLHAIAALRVDITCPPRVHQLYARVANGVGSRRHSPACRAAPAHGRHPTASRATARARDGVRSRRSARACDDSVGMGEAGHRTSSVCGRGRPRGGRDKWSRAGSGSASGEGAV